MLVLGLGDYTDCGSALLDNGRVVAAINDERLVRKPSVLGIPRESIREVLALAGVQPDAVQAVAVGTINRRLVSGYTEFLGGWFGSNGKRLDQRVVDPATQLRRRRATGPWSQAVTSLRGIPTFKHRRNTLRRVLRSEFGIRAPVRFVDHHYCHATAAYFTSDFGPDATVFTIDHGGDDVSAKVFDVTEGRMTEIMTVSSFDSLGAFYTCIAELCGFDPGRDERKVSGLAAHGQPAHVDLLDSLITFEDGGFVNRGGIPFEASVETVRRALPDRWEKADLAASVQAHTERLVLEFVRYWVEQTGHRDVALGGGLFDNARLNQRIHELDEVERCFVQPGMSDSGIGIGAALAVTYERVPRPETNTRAFEGVYLGPEYGPDEMEAELGRAGVQAERPEDLEAEVARLLVQGALVSRFSGRMECGPRALGNRVILFQPTDPTVGDWLNQRLGRSGFSPFGPVVLEEYADQCFHGREGAERAARFMTMAFACTDWMRDHCPGVVHVDGTARPQIVRRQDNPGLHRILEEYHRLTGLPALLSTSFSFQGEPIVCTPADAVRVFGLGHLDYLALGPFLASNPTSISLEGLSIGISEIGAKRMSVSG
ncbi:MAG: carbamoyltransferase [Gemmatimonadetes bacterium]|nr:carbamoyltransferase [Gemmatimonadota bacterium]